MTFVVPVGDLAAVHAAFAAAPGCPSHYGRNLDALFDVLSVDAWTVVIADLGATRAALGADFARLWSTLTDAAAANPAMSLRIGTYGAEGGAA